MTVLSGWGEHFQVEVVVGLDGQDWGFFQNDVVGLVGEAGSGFDDGVGGTVGVDGDVDRFSEVGQVMARWKAGKTVDRF